MDAERVLLLISSTLFLSYISGVFYNKTRIPDIVWLLVFGMILGPILHFFDAALFLNIFDLMLLVTVALFAFNTGLNFNIQHLLGNAARAFNMAIVSFLATTITVSLALSTILPEHFNVVNGLLLGAMVGGMDGISITGLINSLARARAYIAVGGFLTSLIIAVRFITATLVGKIQGFPDEQVIYTLYFFIQGAGSLVLSQLITKYDPDSIFFPSSEVFTNLLVPIVLISIVFTSVVAPSLARKQIHPVVPFIDEGIDTEELEETEKPEKNGKKNWEKS